VHDPVGGARALALLADLLLVPLELGRAAVVEVAQRDGDFDFDVVAAPLAGLAAVVPAAAEEAAEEVEWVVPAAVAPALLLALFEGVVAELVVDLAGFGVGERFVGFGDEDKLVVGCWVVAGEWGDRLLDGLCGKGRTGGCLRRADKLTGSCRGGISC
jgi:hypothetical protein